MAEATVTETEDDGVVTLQEKHLPDTEEAYIGVFYTKRGKQEDASDSVKRPLLQHKHWDSRDENHKAADMQAATDGVDLKTSVPQELELAGMDELGCNGSVRSLCSNSSRHECPICSELFDSHGDRRVTLLNCNHALCHHCVAGIMRRAKDQSRLQCPFCRQTTPFPQWEIRRLQEESYSNSFYEPTPALVINLAPGSDLQAVPAPVLCCLAVDTHRNMCECCVDPSCLVRGLGLMRLHSLCISITALLLLFLVLLGCFLYMVVPVMVVAILFSNG